MRMTGIFSGMDTEAMVRQLMNAETMKYTKLKQSRQKVEWRQEAYRNVAKSLSDFKSNNLDILKGGISAPSTFNSLVSSVKSGGEDSSAVKVNFKNNNAPTGDIKLKVYSVAAKDKHVGEEYDQTNTGDEVTDFSSLVNGGSFTVSLDGGAAATIDITKAEIDFELADGATSDGEAVAKAINKKLEKRFGSAYTINDDDTYEESGTQKISASFENGKFSITTAAGYVATLGKGSTGSDMLEKLGLDEGSSTAVNTKATLKDLGLADSDILLNYGGKTETLKTTDTLEQAMAKINASDLGITLSYNKGSSTFALESKTSGAQSKIELGQFGNRETLNFLGKLNLVKNVSPAVTNDPDGNDDYDWSTIHTAAADTVFEYNGQIYSRETASFELDGMDLTLTPDAVGKDASNANVPKEYSISVTRDTTKPMEAIKKFVEEYNKLVDVLTGQTNTARPKSDKYTYYEPLSDEQKDAMSEDDIKKWEEKAKTGLLYRDTILGGISSQMRSMAYTMVKLSDGSELSLFQIGITTTNNTKDGGRLTIDEDKLKAALEKNPSGVEELFTKSAPTTAEGSSLTKEQRQAQTGIAGRLTGIIDSAVGLNGTIREKAGIENTSSAFNNMLYRELSQYDRKLDDMLKYLQKREDHYYSMFARMEQAMNQSNNQMSALVGSMGQGQ
jgi:flagellar hook-associated protein 2